MVPETASERVHGEIRLPDASHGRVAAGFGWHYLSNATLSNAASFVLCVFRRVKDHHNLLHSSPLWEKTCVRQVVLDKWFPLTAQAGTSAFSETPRVA